MLAIAVSDTKEAIADFMTRGGWSFPVVLGADYAAGAYGVRGIPTVVVIDSEGRIVDRVVGRATASYLSAVVDGLTR